MGERKRPVLTKNIRTPLKAFIELKSFACENSKKQNNNDVRS